MTSLSSQKRTVIETLLELNYSVRAIVRFIHHSPSTISVEIHQSKANENITNCHQHKRVVSSSYCSVNSCNLTFLKQYFEFYSVLYVL